MRILRKKPVENGIRKKDEKLSDEKFDSCKHKKRSSKMTIAMQLGLVGGVLGAAAGAIGGAIFWLGRAY